MITLEEMIKRLAPPTGKVRMVLDTDTYNEIDDQFALAWALKSPERIALEAVYAAPFFNNRSKGPGDGMEKSYNEILNIFKLLDIPVGDKAYRGSDRFLEFGAAVESDASRDLVRRAMAMPDGELLYVVGLGAFTNIASALLMEPKIAEKVVLVVLGGNSHNWHTAKEFNFIQDVRAAQIIFDSGAPVVQIPCMNVADHMITTIPELDHYLYGKSNVGTYLADIVRTYTNEPFGWSKVIWDVAAVAWIINPEWISSNIVHTPILSSDCTYSVDHARHMMRCAYAVDRDKIFGDIFAKLV